MTLIMQEKTKAKEKQEESPMLKVLLQPEYSDLCEEVEDDLTKAEPVLISAKKNVENINRNDLKRSGDTLSLLQMSCWP